MSIRIHGLSRFLAGPLLASLFVVADGVAAADMPKRSGRAAARPGGAEAGPAAKDGDRVRSARSRSRAGRRDAETQPEDLFGVSWFRSLAGARRAAAKNESQESGKPIFCFRVLGDLSGYM